LVATRTTREISGPRLFTRAEVLAILKIGETTLFWLQRTKKLTAIRIGSRVLFNAAQIERIAACGAVLQRPKRKPPSSAIGRWPKVIRSSARARRRPRQRSSHRSAERGDASLRQGLTHERPPPPHRAGRGRGGGDNQVKQTEFTASSASLQPDNTICPSGPIAPRRACWSAALRSCLVHTPKRMRRHVHSLR